MYGELHFWILTYCGLMMPYGNIDLVNTTDVTAYFLTAPCHYLNQCWLFIMFYGIPSNFTTNAHEQVFRHHTFKITTTSPRAQWVNSEMSSMHWWHFTVNSLGPGRCGSHLKTRVKSELSSTRNKPMSAPVYWSPGHQHGTDYIG